jgi:hypothetical protein
MMIAHHWPYGSRRAVPTVGLDRPAKRNAPLATLAAIAREF